MKTLEIIIVLLLLLSIFAGRFATLLDKMINEGKIPTTSNIMLYFLNIFLVSLIGYKILMPTRHYTRLIAKNKNEVITIKTIRIMYILSIGSLFGVLLAFVFIMSFGR